MAGFGGPLALYTWTRVIGAARETKSTTHNLRSTSGGPDGERTMERLGLKWHDILINFRNIELMLTQETFPAPRLCWVHRHIFVLDLLNYSPEIRDNSYLKN